MSDEMILVPRAELLAWAQDWLRENDPGDGTDCVTPFDWHLLKTPAEAHCTTCSCVPGMTPAVRFDTTPAEKEGAVRDHLIRMGWTPPSESQEQGGGECCHSWQDYGHMNVVRCNKCEARAVNGYEDRPFTAPPSAATPLSREHGSVQEMFNPSAPVGVEAVFSLIRACESAVRRLGWRSNDYSLGHEARMLAQGYENGAFQSARETLRALAQQPEAVDEAMVERIAALLHEEATDEPWTVAGVDHDGPDRDYYRALARKVIVSAGQQPASVDEESVVVPRWFMEKLAKDTRGIGMFEMSAAIRRVALAAQPGGSDNDR